MQYVEEVNHYLTYTLKDAMLSLWVTTVVSITILKIFL